MMCPSCNATARCTDTRQTREGRRRRYRCTKCKVRLTTFEQIIHSAKDSTHGDLKAFRQAESAKLRADLRKRLLQAVDDILG